MDRTQDKPAFAEAMLRLSAAAIIGELTAKRLAVFEDALADLPIASIVQAADYAVREWEPSEGERFFLPATLRKMAKAHRDEHEAKERQAKQLPAPDTTDTEVRSALRAIFQTLDAHQPARQPETDIRTLAAAGQHNPPDPTRWLPLTEDFGPERRRPQPTTSMAHLMDHAYDQEDEPHATA